jgi:uncharacterized protein involved in exopolysaccharide biosynthesis
MTSIDHLPAQKVKTGELAFYFIKRLRLFRSSIYKINLARLFRGGRLNDAGRLPRYIVLFSLMSAAVWFPIVSYLKFTPYSYTSTVSLILPGNGSSSSVNLSNIGQSTTSSSSAYSSNAISPTETYKRLLNANRVRLSAANALGLDITGVSEARIKLVDETSLIHFEMNGASPEMAQKKADYLLAAFQAELEILREDEQQNRENAARRAIDGYGIDMGKVRNRITVVQTQSGLMSFDHYQQLNTKVDTLEDEVREVEVDFRQAEDRVADLAKSLGVSSEIAALNLRLHADEQFQNLTTAVSEHASKLAQKRGKFGDRHPQVISANAALMGTMTEMAARAHALTGLDQATILDVIDVSPGTERGALLAELVKATSDCEGLKAKFKLLKEILVEKRADMVRLAPFATQLDELSRDYQVAEAVFASAMARNDSTKSDVYASYPLVQVLEDASLPLQPSSPRRTIALAAGIAACIMFFMGLVLSWIRRPIINRILAEPTDN